MARSILLVKLWAILAHDEFFKAFQSGKIGHQHGQTNWYYKNFIQWISDQDHHIELTGNEIGLQIHSEKHS